jgi:hypothetical protein
MRAVCLYSGFVLSATVLYSLNLSRMELFDAAHFFPLWLLAEREKTWDTISFFFFGFF